MRYCAFFFCTKPLKLDVCLTWTHQLLLGRGLITFYVLDSLVGSGYYTEQCGAGPIEVFYFKNKFFWKVLLFMHKNKILRSF